MRKNVLYYFAAFALLLFTFFFFNRAYREVVKYSDLTNRANTLYSGFRNISRQIKTAAVLDKELVAATSSSPAARLFLTDSLAIIRQLEMLNATVRDSVNIKIASELAARVRSELSWIINSNVPDSIIHGSSPGHITAFLSIDSLANKGIGRTEYLLDYRKDKLNKATRDLRIGMLLFIIISVALLFYTSVNLFRERTKTKKKDKQLEQRKELFASIVNSSDNAIMSETLDGIVTSWNYGAERIFGYAAADIIGKPISILLPHHLRNEENDILEEIRNGKRIEDYETERVQKNGKIIHVALTASAIRDENGNITGASKIARDITKQKLAEEEIIDAYKEKETVLNRISDGVVSVDNDWRYTFLNDAAMATHPLSKEETLGRVIWDVHPGMKGTIFWDKYHEAMLERKVVEIEDHYAPMDIWFSVKVYPSSDGLTIFYKNITESKRAEKQLSQTLKEVTDYKFALDEASIVAITDQKGIIRHANQNFCKISKYPMEELIGQDHRIINSGYHSKEFIRELWVTIANGKIWKGELKNKAKDGTVYWVDTTIVPFLDDKGKPYQYVAIRSDITERKQVEENLQKSLKEIAEYKYALDESSIIAITDQKGIIKHANQNFCKISKYSLEELIGQDHRIINSGHHPKEFIRELWVTIANGKIWKGELKNKAKGGTIYWVDTTIVPFLDDKGKPYQYVAIRSDITERKQVEENLQKSLKETADYKYALDESSIIAITDQKGIIKHANQNFCKISKYSLEELIGQDHRIINSGHHPKEFIRDIWVTIANGKIWKGELKNKAKDGTIYWVDTTIVPFLDDKGKPYQYVAIRSDITERKKVEDDLASSEKLYKTIASSIPGSVIVLLDTEFRYLLIEGDILDKMGYSKEKLLGNKAENVLSPEIFEEARREFDRVLKGEVITRETRRGDLDLISRYVPLKDENNKVYAILVAATDITQLKDAQRSVTDLNRNLEEKISYRTLELIKTNEELEAFSYSVSHDLRAPLRAIIGYSAILEEDYGDKLGNDAKEVIDVIKSSTEKMGRLIDDLLAFSRMGKREIFKMNMDTSMLVSEVIEDLTSAHKPPATICWDLHPLPAMNADLNTIRQVWINLISNAIKYSGNKAHPCIEIGSSAEKDRTVFYIRDNGAGFDEQYKDKLFKVFQRLHDADEFEGTGVGLALVERIISKHGGKVWAEGKENEGACFYFSLPG